jgi:hypothetical protein
MYWPWYDPYGPKHAVNSSHMYIINNPYMWQDGILIIVTTVWTHLRLIYLSHFHEIPYRPFFYTSSPSMCDCRENGLIGIIFYLSAGQPQATGGPHNSWRTSLMVEDSVECLSVVKSCEEKTLIFWTHTKLNSRAWAYHATLWGVESKERLGKLHALRRVVQHLLSSCI